MGQLNPTLASRIAKRVAFGIYLRTGKRIAAADIETKFNPWHDPKNGRFTFTGLGRYFGRGSRSDRSGDASGEGSASTRSVTPGNRGGWRDGGFTGSGGGRTGGGGATGSWAAEPRSAPKPIPRKKRPASRQVRPARGAVATVNRPKLIRVTKNGYDYDLDEAKRTRRVNGKLALNPTQGRSRRAQADAGGADRRATDDGGHYIAARFDGPRDTFNHFAQDANFNRGAYRVIEDGWAKDINAGRSVFVDIVPHYEGSSLRPSSITVTWYVDGARTWKVFPNEKKGK